MGCMNTATATRQLRPGDVSGLVPGLIVLVGTEQTTSNPVAAQTTGIFIAQVM